jgi:hypothetical protein
VRFFNKPKTAWKHLTIKCRYELPAAVNQLFYYEVRVMKTHIEDNDLDDKVKLLLSVHDQQVSEVRRLRCTVGNHTNRANGKAAMYVIPREL